jgi:hypothetical protein
MGVSLDVMPPPDRPAAGESATHLFTLVISRCNPSDKPLPSGGEQSREGIEAEAGQAASRAVRFVKKSFAMGVPFDAAF